jgi:hypothetical protein
MRTWARGLAFFEVVTRKITAYSDKLLRVLPGFLDLSSDSKRVRTENKPHGGMEKNWLIIFGMVRFWTLNYQDSLHNLH